MNKLIVNLENITVALPEDKVIIEKEEYDMLKKNANKGKYMTMNELLELLSVSRPWLIENILYRPSIKNDIDIEKNPNGFVKYPNSHGSKYLFLASKTKEYFEKNFREILLDT
ncbi:hypothetical protein D8827_04790 [Streptococcus intermedius]|jgi:hypothetical protein|uniref:DUF771 domain-containing protein n=5 Tax=Streptococcus TaxID=1301 RepID=T1ZH53_STRIT|nr:MULTISPECIES: DUF771 domain-containing protein [Streptococcus]HEP3076518.1 DUF771 domain-containing protein [Streptococcus pyogenes]AGU77061.1 hypothetical protein SIR_1714 [Streptococcus intermedius B196]MBC5619461.1 DUF771 domain-containing protein [Streptococcus hominis]MCB6584329.1 DUF771 domain-containing protein [Streptococcus gordonii]MCB7053415.1 DUF771 domain-containing protein [Streptococcus gordonii]